VLFSFPRKANRAIDALFSFLHQYVPESRDSFRFLTLAPNAFGLRVERENCGQQATQPPTGIAGHFFDCRPSRFVYSPKGRCGGLHRLISVHLH
jgi:hypothetical protein